MNSEQFEDLLLSLIAPLLSGLAVFERHARYIGVTPEEAMAHELLDVHERLRTASEGLREANWPPKAEQIRTMLAEAYRHGLRVLSALDDADMAGFRGRSMRALLGARVPMCEAIYPLASHFSVIHKFFLDQRKQDIPKRIVERSQDDQDLPGGIHHIENDRKQRGGFSIYVPEAIDRNASYPVIFALHGGSGHGSSMLWSWLRTVRTEEVVLVTPTSLNETWALNDPQQDAQNLQRILDAIRRIVKVDENSIMLTGMSDGGTFTYVLGFGDASPFTHLAPYSSFFDPSLIQFVSRERLLGLPVCITHGVHDTMFPVDMARTASKVLADAGANVVYHEIPDLAHTYPMDLNPTLVDWFLNRD